MKFRRKRWHCSHALLRGIYGDEINHVGGYRLQCLACGAYLSGPVSTISRNALLEDDDEDFK